MIDIQLKESLNQKIQDGEFSIADLPGYMLLFCQIGNEVEDIQEEVEGWDRGVQVELDGAAAHWISVKDGKFTTGTGMLENADLTLALVGIAAVDIFSGEVEAESAFTSGALKLQGDLNDAIRFNTLLELVIEEIEY